MPTGYTAKSYGNIRYDSTQSSFIGDETNPKITYGGTTVDLPSVPDDAKWAVWKKIPVGSRNIRWKITKTCDVHNASLQVFHYGTGNLLIGTPFSIDTYRDTLSWQYPINKLHDVGSTKHYHFSPTSAGYTSFYDYLSRGNWGQYMFPMWTYRSKVHNPTQTGSYNLVSAYNMLFGLNSYENDVNYNASAFSGLSAEASSTAIDDFNDGFAQCLGDALAALFIPNFPPGFLPKDDIVNGNGKPFFKLDNNMHLFTVEGENIYWTGNILGGLDGKPSEMDDLNPQYPITIDEDALTFNGHSFKIVFPDSPVTWEEACQLCFEAGGHLATASSSAKQNFIYTNLVQPGGKDAWIGGLRYDTPTTWPYWWITNELISYTNWNPGEPNNLGGEWYVEMYVSNGKWNDLSGGAKLSAYVCEWDAVI